MAKENVTQINNLPEQPVEYIFHRWGRLYTSKTPNCQLEQCKSICEYKIKFGIKSMQALLYSGDNQSTLEIKKGLVKDSGVFTVNGEEKGKIQIGTEKVNDVVIASLCLSLKNKGFVLKRDFTSSNSRFETGIFIEDIETHAIYAKIWKDMKFGFLDFKSQINLIKYILGKGLLLRGIFCENSFRNDTESFIGIMQLLVLYFHYIEARFNTNSTTS